MDPSLVGRLFVEIGPMHELDQVSAFDDGESWAVVVDGTVVTLELDPERGTLMLTGEVGQPTADVPRVHAALLQYNLAWRETGGVRMALDGPAGKVMQLYELATDGLDAQRLGGVVKQFAALLAGWRELVERGPLAAAQAEGAGDRPPFLGGMIRA